MVDTKSHLSLELNSCRFYSGSGWMKTLMLFVALFLIMLGYFYWQADKARDGFLKRAKSHSRMVSGMIGLSLNNAIASQEVIEEIIETFLAGSARFVDYLDTIEPFSVDELTGFSKEAGLVGISIINQSSKMLDGPTGWGVATSSCQASSALQSYPEQNLYILTWSRDVAPGCILLGYSSSGIDKLKARLGIRQLLDDMAGLPLIKYVRFEKGGSANHKREPSVTLIRNPGNNVAETTIAFRDEILVVGIDANRYIKRIDDLWAEFILFSAILGCMSLFFSWLMYRSQAAFLQKAMDFERQLARQHEEAALGRAAATISHEIKNPLNAISMGLQRLHFECDLPEQQKKLIDSMQLAVSRTNNIISGLKQYTRPINPEYQQMFPAQAIGSLLTLYRARCLDTSVKIIYSAESKSTIEADPSLLGQVFENLLKNAIEAQPDGGYVNITVGIDENFILTMENPGCPVAADDIFTLAEPYFTTKTNGTGLGLAVCRRIVEAHHGSLRLEVVEPSIFKVIVELPTLQLEKGKR